MSERSRRIVSVVTPWRRARSRDVDRALLQREHVDRPLAVVLELRAVAARCHQVRSIASRIAAIGPSSAIRR
jgi:hypothetical protein